MLERECAQAKFQTLLGTKIISVTRDSDFRVETTAGIFRSTSVVIATGGLSIPKMGATAFGYEIARQFNINIIPTRPALVDRATWDAAQAISAARGNVQDAEQPRTRPGRRYQYRGRLWCKICKRRMRGVTRTTPHARNPAPGGVAGGGGCPLTAPVRSGRPGCGSCRRRDRDVAAGG